MILSARFDKHWGHWDSVTGRVIVYTIEFQDVYQALKFLEPYPPGDYMAVFDRATQQISLVPEVEDETTFEFLPPWD